MVATTECAVDLDAKFYRKHSSLQYGLSRKLLDTCNFNSHARILDIGCGDGRITAEIAHRVPGGEVIGIDASANMISLARTSFPGSRFQNLEFQCLKAEDLCFPAEFDTIASFSCLHWIKEPQKTLRQLCSMLNADGDLIVLTYPKESVFYKFLDEVLISYPEYREKSIYQAMLSIREYKEILKNEIDLSSFEFQNLLATYKDKAELKNFIRGWLTSFVPLPEHLHNEFLELAAEKSLSYAWDIKNGMINLPYTALTITGKKANLNAATRNKNYKIS